MYLLYSLNFPAPPNFLFYITQLWFCFQSILMCSRDELYLDITYWLDVLVYAVIQFCYFRALSRQMPAVFSFCKTETLKQFLRYICWWSHNFHGYYLTTSQFFLLFEENLYVPHKIAGAQTDFSCCGLWDYCKALCRVLHLWRNNRVHQYGFRDDLLERTSVEKDLDVLVDSRLDVSKQSALVAKKGQWYPGMCLKIVWQEGWGRWSSPSALHWWGHI